MNTKIEEIVIDVIAGECKADKRSIHTDHRLYEDLLLTDEQVDNVVQVCNMRLGRNVAPDMVLCDVGDVITAFVD